MVIMVSTADTRVQHTRMFYTFWLYVSRFAEINVTRTIAILFGEILQTLRSVGWNVIGTNNDTGFAITEVLHHFAVIQIKQNNANI